MNKIEISKLAAIICITLTLLILITYYLRTKNRIKKIIITGLTGLGTFIFIKTLLSFMSIYIPTNIFTVGVSSILGIPGAIISCLIIVI